MRKTSFVIFPAGLALVLAACGASSSSSSTSATTVPPVAPATTAAPSPGADASSYTVTTGSVAGVGTVLVDGAGRTLYILTSEAGGKITCTDANGCTTYWPDTELPSGVTAPIAGSGIQASLLSAVKDASGDLYTTYAGYPLYTFSGDKAAGSADGEGIKSFGGTWYAMNPDGTPVTAETTAATAAPATHTAATSPPATSPPATSPPATSPPAPVTDAPTTPPTTKPSPPPTTPPTAPPTTKPPMVTVPSGGYGY